MQVLEVYKPFEIQEIALDNWERRPVKNNFFEFVLIKKGSGTQCINYNYYQYKSGSTFLLPPLQCHSFNIEEQTEFVFLKFTPEFFQSSQFHSANSHEWFQEASYILSNYNQSPGDVIMNEIDKKHINTIVSLILLENRNYKASSGVLIKSFMTSILEILLRNIQQSVQLDLVGESKPDDRITKLLAYINEHIGEPQLLKVDVIAKTFLLSPTYLSEYFKKNVHVSLREYIIKSKLKLVEIRLLNSDYTLTQIADELSFTDVSHLSKTFKKYTGLSMREFKKRGEYVLLKRAACAAN